MSSKRCTYKFANKIRFYQIEFDSLKTGSNQLSNVEKSGLRNGDREDWFYYYCLDLDILSEVKPG